jgi:RHS repeat-associated protein
LIATPSGQVQVIRRSDGTTDTFYVTTDHLGSTDAVLNAAGTVLLRGSFGVHGARRASNWQGAPSSTEWQAIADSTRRGYTGHEQIDNILLVHMNGRVFDPAIGRFLSADPYIDGPETTQGWNRYAYVHGRTLSATDPSGFNNVRQGFTLRSWLNANGTYLSRSDVRKLAQVVEE